MTREWRLIAKNSFWLSFSQVLGRIIGFFYFVFLARSLSVEQFGVYSWVLGFVYNFYPLADFGLERMVMRDIPRLPQKTKFYLQRLFPLRFVLALISLLACLILVFILGIRGSKIFYTFLFGLTMFPLNLVLIYAFIQNAQEKPKDYAKITILGPLLAALLGVLIIFFHFPYSLLYTTFFFANCLILIGFWLKRRKAEFQQWIIDLPFWRQILKESWIFGVILTLAVFYLRSPLILIGILLGDYWAGIYGAASRFIEAGILIPAGFVLALFPLSSRLLIKDKEKLKKVYLRGLFLLLTSSLPVFLIMFFGAEPIILLVFGANYLEAAPILALMGVLMIFLFVNSLAGSVIQNSTKLKTFLPFAFLNLLMAIIFGLILIPKMGVIGGVWAMIIGEIFGFVVNNVFVFNILNGKN